MFTFTPSELKKRVQALAARPDDRFLELAACLNALQAGATAVQFRDAVASAGLGSRKAYYLVNIAEQFRPHMRFRSRLQKLGWTKCQMIGRHIQGNNFLKLLEYAEQHTAKELAAYAEGMKADMGVRCVLLYFTPGEYRQYEKAVLTFGGTKRGRGLTDKELATIKMAKKALSG